MPCHENCTFPQNTILMVFLLTIIICTFAAEISTKTKTDMKIIIQTPPLPLPLMGGEWLTPYLPDRNP